MPANHPSIDLSRQGEKLLVDCFDTAVLLRRDSDKEHFVGFVFAFAQSQKSLATCDP